MVVVTSLIRRAANDAWESSSFNPKGFVDTTNWQAAPIILFVVWYAAFFMLMFMIDYTLGYIATTLAIVEDPKEDPIVKTVRFSVDEDSKEKEALLETEIDIVKARPITSSLFGTIKHLRSQHGRRRVFFRGFAIYGIYELLAGFLALNLNKLPYVGLHAAILLPPILLATLEMTWYQIVISKQSSIRWWFRRLPPTKYWVKIAPAAALKSTCSWLALFLPALLFQSTAHLDTLEKASKEQDQERLSMTFMTILGAGVGAFVARFTLQLLLVLPAHVTLVRVSASMLPEDVETVVPFDRSFGGRVTPAIVGGSGKIGLLDAWKTFSWEARRRLVLMCVKIAFIYVSTFVGAIAIPALGLWIFTMVAKNM